jgi:SAM-dependent methyltransferase
VPHARHNPADHRQISEHLGVRCGFRGGIVQDPPSSRVDVARNISDTSDLRVAVGGTFLPWDGAMGEHRSVEIRCPSCGLEGLRWSAGSPNELQCEQCQARTAVADGILDLLPHAAPPPSLAQSLMERSVVRIYDSRLWRRSIWARAALGLSFEQECALIVNAAQLAGHEVVLDLACGPAIYLRPLASALPRGLAVGVDRSMPMLRNASRRVRTEEPTNLLLIHADAGDLPFAASQFDLVNCCGAFHLFPALDRVLAEVCRVLRPGGKLTLAAFRRRATRVSARVAEIRRSWSGLDAFVPSEFAGRLEQAGFAETRCLYARRAWFLMAATRVW